jgi:SAM-dependent methyltransferase
MRAPLAEEIEAAQRATWDRFSAGWERWDAVVQRMLGPVGEVMIRSLGVRADQQHLDVASGTGEPGLTIAQLAPSGRVVLTDLAPDMLAAARRIAAALGIDNIEAHECSAGALPFPDDTFDSATCRFGLMFVPDPPRTIAELARVVRPGGRVAVSVWAGADANPWATIPRAAVATETAQPAPDADAPGMFRFASPGAVAALYQAAGFWDVTESDVPLALTTDSPDQYWRLLTELSLPVGIVLEQLDDAARQRIARTVISQVQRFHTSGSVRIPGVSRCIVGTT